MPTSLTPEPYVVDGEIADLKFGKSYVTEEIHFSGGLRGAPTNLGWALYPVSDDENSNAIVFDSPEFHFRFATQECGVKYLGTCMKYMSGDRSPSMDVWEFGERDPQNGLSAADSWSTIGHRASMADDGRYAELASYVSASLRAASLRLRDVSNGYHDQLKWALADKRSPGRWFSNAALRDLYADFHSLASELSSARDHVATVAAIHVGAPDRIDSVAKLEDWAGRSANQSCKANPMVHLLLGALGSKETPGWLRRMGDIRNEMLHRIPMSANRSVAGLVLELTQTSLGAVSTTRLAAPPSTAPLSEQEPDPLVTLSEFSMNLESLCRALWKFAKYPAEPVRFGVGSS